MIKTIFFILNPEEEDKKKKEIWFEILNTREKKIDI